MMKNVMLVMTLLLSSTVWAAEYVPYGESLLAKFVAVKSVNEVAVEIETWPGMKRAVTVLLPNLDLPSASAQVPLCEQQLAIRGQRFSEDFLAKSGELKVQHLVMKTTTDVSGKGDLVTGLGSLRDALIKEGLARPEGQAGQPWCHDAP
ncbi:MAG: hypothetical protein RQ715_11175 [Methylococcales bacterium]|nr:hypothetical protein [Methylococcales bacterium]